MLLRARLAHRHRCLQARRKPPLECAAEGEALRVFAERHIAGVREIEAGALASWSLRPTMAIVCQKEMTPREIVSLQADGQRCVSLLEEREPCEGLAFALHDLRHLGKFFEPALHAEQRGFFARVRLALDSDAWRELDGSLDARWIADRNAVLADMNGSAVFLFAALKMRLRMAARRRYWSLRGETGPSAGPLSEGEELAFAPLLEACLDGLGLEAGVRDAARAISCKRDAPPHAERFADSFRHA
jgi:hypothetical protein